MAYWVQRFLQMSLAFQKLIAIVWNHEYTRHLIQVSATATQKPLSLHAQKNVSEPKCVNCRLPTILHSRLLPLLSINFELQSAELELLFRASCCLVQHPGEHPDAS